MEIAILLALGAAVWLWLDSLNARENAVRAARAACGGQQWLLLDDTVAIARIGFARDRSDTLRIRRIYDFEYTDTGDNRCGGSVEMLGSRVMDVRME
jgi:hypothetical protein